MNRFALLLPLPLLVAPLWGAADAQLLALMPPDAKIMAGVDVALTKASPFGQLLLTRFGGEKGLKDLDAATGFNPSTDLYEILAAGNTEKDGVIALRGAFEVSRLGDLGKTLGVHRGVTLYDATDGLAGAFLNGNIALLGTKARVEGAIDRWVDGAAASSALSGEALRISGTAHAWVTCNDLSAVQLAAGASKDPQAQMVQNLAAALLKISAGINFGDQAITGTSSVTARSAQDAQGLADLLKLVSSMQQPNSPFGTLAPVITAQGDTVSVSLSIPQTAIELMLPH